MLMANLNNVISLIQRFSSLGSIGMGVRNPIPDQSQTQPQDWFDKLVDRIQKLPKIIMFISVMVIFVWPIFNHDAFVGWTAAVTGIPENLWLLIFLVAGGWATNTVVQGFRSNYNSYMSSMDTDYSYGSDYSGSSYGNFSNLSNDQTALIQTPDTHNDSIAAWKNKSGTK